MPMAATIGISASTASSVGALYRDHFQWLSRYLRGRLACAHVATDIAQDTFVCLIAGASRQPVDAIDEPRAYLTTIAQRLLANHFRRQTLEQAYLQTLATHPQAITISVEERLIVLETLQRIDAALDRIPSRARMAFLMSQFDGMTYAAIAVALNVHERTVKRYMAQAFEQCLRCLC